MATATLNFQARLQSASGGLVPDGNYSVEFKIYDSAASGLSGQGICSGDSSSDDCWWRETRIGVNAVKVKNGYLSANLGSVTGFPSNMPWSSDLWLSMNIGGIGGPAWDGEMVPRIKLTAVPYAFEADKIDGLDSSQLTQLAPASQQLINSALSALSINQTGSGALLDLRGDGGTALSLDKSGNAVLGAGLTLGDSTSTAAGTLRWTGTDFEGFDGTTWKSLTQGGGGIGIPFISKIKSADQSTTSNTVFQDISELSFNIGANETWIFRYTLTGSSSTAGDFKFSLSAPGATCKFGTIDPEGATSNANLACGATSGTVPGNNTNDIYEVAGTVTNGSTPTTVSLRYAQQTVDAGNAIIRAGSYLEASRSIGPSATIQAITQNGNSLGEDMKIGTVDNYGLKFIANGVDALNIAANGDAVFAANVSATAFNGSGAGLTTLNASSVSSGTLSDDRLSSNISRLDAAQLYSAAQTFSNGLIITPGQSLGINAETLTDLTGSGLTNSSGALSVSYGTTAGTAVEGDKTLVCASGTGNLSGGGNTITLGGGGTCGGLTIVNNPTFSGNVTAASFTGSGSSLTGLDASNISSGSLSDSRLSSNVALLNGTQTFSGSKSFSAGLAITSGQNLTINAESFSDLTGTGLVNTSGALSVSYGSAAGSAVEGNKTLTCASGSGNLSGGGGTITLGSGGSCNGLSMVNSPSFSGSVTASSFTGSGSGLTSLSGTEISSGTINDLRLSSNVALLNSSQTYTALKTFSNGLSITGGGSTPFSVANGGTTYLSVDTTSTGFLRIGGTGVSSTGIMLVLGHKGNSSADPVGGTNGAQYYNSVSNKFRCYENGTWKDCISSTSVRSFIDTVADAVVDNNTTNYWDLGAENNNSHPNIVPSSTGKSILGIATMETTATSNNDVEVSGRIERGIGAVPTCNTGLQVGGNPGVFSTNNGSTKASTVTFLDTPATTSTVYYIFCSDTATAGTGANVSRIRFTLQEVNNSN